MAVRQIALSCSLALALGACAGSGAPPPGLAERTVGDPIDVGSGLATISESAAPVQTSAPLSSVIVEVRGYDGRPAPGVRFSYKGTRAGRAVSSAAGKASLRLPAGRYTFAIQGGCDDEIEVIEKLDAGTLDLPEESRVRIALTARWRHRIIPQTSVVFFTDNPWRRNEPVRIGYHVMDRCTGLLADMASLPTFGFRTTPNLEVVGTPVMRTDERAVAVVRVRCVAEGDAALVIFDESNQTDAEAKIDLLRVRPPPVVSRPWCR